MRDDCKHYTVGDAVLSGEVALRTLDPIFRRSPFTSTRAPSGAVPLLRLRSELSFLRDILIMDTNAISTPISQALLFHSFQQDRVTHI